MHCPGEDDIYNFSYSFFLKGVRRNPNGELTFYSFYRFYRFLEVKGGISI